MDQILKPKLTYEQLRLFTLDLLESQTAGEAKALIDPLIEQLCLLSSIDLLFWSNRSGHLDCG